MTITAADVGKDIDATISGVGRRARVVAVSGGRVTLDVRDLGQVNVAASSISSWATHVPGADIAWTAPGGPVRGALRDVRGGRGRFRGR